MKEGWREITPAQAKSMIAPVLARVNTQMSTEDFLSFVENVSGLLLARETDIYMFAHKTFQEYLAAIYIRDNHLGQELISRVGDVWWQETIRLYCAQADATAVIQACLEDGNPSISKLLLALDCLREAREVQPEVKDEVEYLLAQGMEDTDPERQHIVAEVLLTRRLRHMKQLTEHIFVDSSFITCGEYQVFLDERRERGRYLQPDHWLDYRFSPGESLKPVLGVRASDAAEFCAWLTEREQEPWHYRLPKQGELAQVATEYLLHGLPPHTGYWLHQRGEFAWIGESVSLQNDRLQGIIDRALDFDCTLVLDRTRALAFNRARTLDLDLALARIRVRTLDLDRIRALDRPLDRIRVFSTAFSIAPSSSIAPLISVSPAPSPSIAPSPSPSTSAAKIRKDIFSKA